MSDPIRERLNEMIMFNGRGEAVETPSSLALRAVLDLADYWAAAPGNSDGLRTNCMTNGCAAYWVRDAIATALGVEPDA